MRDKTVDTVPVAGGDYRVARWRGADSAVLAVHGITASHMGWPRVIRALTGDYDVYAPDLRGRGDSNVLPPPYGFAAHVEDLIALLDFYQLESVVYVGHSLGAYIGLDLAIAAPSRLRGLVLVDGGIALPLRPGSTPEDVIKGVLGPALARLEQVYPDRPSYHRFWESHPAFQDEGAWNEDVVAFADYDLGGAAPRFTSRVNPEAVRADAYGPLSPSMVNRVDEVAHPMLLLTATRGLLNQAEPLLPPAAVAEKGERNENLRVAEIADTNHYSITMGAGAARVAAHIDTFIAGLD
ncbi:MAG: alpha/beta hydrolase [Gammaproteobacteria bacterium]|jgi:pimeloyl-ACP methyl ester carboxylesterase|nr:alpha/beta hydrolase [Gammaproteobacteria bacterium]HJP34963.1 alpha/beta hydrolase [Gammaproteobacteria bacterium]